MIAEETTYGTPVTPTRGYEFNSESMALDIERLESAGLRAGTRVLRSDRWAAGAKSVGGTIEMDLQNKSFGLWLKHMFGGFAVATPGGATNARTHTATPGDLPVGLTVQVGRASENGTVNAFTYHGCKVASWDLSADVGEIGKLSVDLIGEDEDTSTSLATASYASSSSLLVFTQATLSVAGSDVDVRSATLAGDNGLDVDRYKLGSALRKAPVEAAMRAYTGTLDAYFANLTAYNRFVNGTEAALVLEFVGATIEGAFNFGLEVTCNVRFDGETPTVGGPDEIAQSLPFKCVSADGTPGSAITAVYTTTDTAA
jgi:hypothetical protein